MVLNNTKQLNLSKYKMKKNIITLGLFGLLFLSLPTLGLANNNPDPITVTLEKPKVSMEEMKARILVIQNMDKSSLSRAEKKQLRSEVKTIQKELKTQGGGVYISVGAIIIILLIILIIF
jgi:hypothetical protein